MSEGSHTCCEASEPWAKGQGRREDLERGLGESHVRSARLGDRPGFSLDSFLCLYILYPPKKENRPQRKKREKEQHHVETQTKCDDISGRGLARAAWAAATVLDLRHAFFVFSSKAAARP